MTYDDIQNWYNCLKVGTKIEINGKFLMKLDNIHYSTEHTFVGLDDGEIYHFSFYINPDNFQYIKVVRNIDWKQITCFYEGANNDKNAVV